MIPLRMHHVGCLVNDIEQARCIYSGTSIAESTSPIIRVESQLVSVCFLSMSGDTFLELVQPDEENGHLRKLLNQGRRYYHIGFKCDNLEEAVLQLVSSGSHVLNRFESEAFDGAQCVFLVNRERQLVELIDDVNNES